MEAKLIADPEWIELKSGNAMTLDVAQFERAHQIFRRKRPAEMDDHDFEIVESAIRLYNGFLLANWTQEWCTTARDRFHRHYIAMLDRASQFYERKGRYVEVLALSELLFESDPAHERMHRRVMRVYHQIGDRSNAVRQYARCVEALSNELGMPPGQKTMALLARIREGGQTREPILNRQAPEWLQTLRSM